MTTMTLDNTGTQRLEELVDRLLAALLGNGKDAEADSAPNASLSRSVHEARRLRQSADPASGAGQVLDGALSILAEVDTAGATDTQLRWLYAEWLDIARRRFAGGNAMLYSSGTGRAAVLIPTGDDNATLEVAAVLGMRWLVGKQVSRRSLRGLRPLHNKNGQGGESWS